MPTMIDQREVTNAFLALVAAGTGKQVGDNRMVDDPDTAEPWCIVYPLPGTHLSGPWDDDSADAQYLYQVTSFGRTREQCEWMRDTVRRSVVLRDGAGGWAVPLDDGDTWSVISRLLEEPGGGIDREGVAPNLIFTAADRFRVHVTPS